VTSPRYSPIKVPGRIFSNVLTPFPISLSSSTDNYMIWRYEMIWINLRRSCSKELPSIDAIKVWTTHSTQSFIMKQRAYTFYTSIHRTIGIINYGFLFERINDERNNSILPWHQSHIWGKSDGGSTSLQGCPLLSHKCALPDKQWLSCYLCTTPNSSSDEQALYKL